MIPGQWNKVLDINQDFDISWGTEEYSINDMPEQAA